MEGADNASAQSQPTKLCSNCKRDINAATFDLHESHCKRHIMLCEICEEPVPIREKDEHFQENHAPKPCPSCGEQVPMDKMEDHEDKCPERKVECKYCELEVKHKEYGDHVDACGSRTDYCDLCGQRVMLKDMDEHKMAKCASVRAESPLDQHTLDNLEGLTPPHAHEHQFGDGSGYAYPYYFYGDEYGYYDDRYDNEYGRYGDAHVHERSQSPVEVHTRPPDPQPSSPPPYSADDNVHVDPQWLQTVAEVCGEEDLDRVLAQNMFYMNVKHVTARDEYVPIEREVVEEGMAADRQREHEQQQVDKDEDLARRLQHEYDNKLAEERRDAEMARHLQQQLLQQSSKVPHNNDTRSQAPDLHQDAKLARKLQEKEDNRVSYQRRRVPTSPPPQDVEDDAELARMLQKEEESRNSAMNYRQGDVTTFSPGGSHSNTPAFGAHVANNEHTLPYNNETAQGGGYGYEMSHSNPSAYDFHSESYSPHSSLHGDDEQPRAKTPPPTHQRGHGKNERASTSGDVSYGDEEENIPCQFCQKLVPFSQIMYHQKQCTADYCKCPRCASRRSLQSHLSSSSQQTRPSKQYNVDALLRAKSPDEDNSQENTVPCQFCGEQYSENVIIPHQALCEHNPDKHLKDAYRPEPTPRPCPQPHPPRGPVSLQRFPLHAVDQDPEIPCEFCGVGFPSSRINAHQPTCTKNPDFSSLMQQQALGAQSSPGFVASHEDVAMGPCEFCGEQIPLTDLFRHEATCRLHQHYLIQVPPPRPSEDSCGSLLEPKTDNSEPHNLQPAASPRMDKNASQISTQVPPFSPLHSAAGPFNIPKPGTSSQPIYSPAQTVTAPKLQSINATPPTIAGVGSGYRPSAAAVHTTPTHTASLTSATLYEAPSPPDNSRKRHSSSSDFSESKVPRLLSASSGSPLDSWPVTTSGGHSLVGRGAQPSYSATALPSAVYPLQESSPGRLGQTVYSSQHPIASAGPFPSGQVPPTTNYLTMLSPETSMSLQPHLVLAPTPESNSPTLPTISATLPVATTSHLHFSSSPSSFGPNNDTTPSPSSRPSYLTGGSLVNHSSSGGSFKLERYTKSTAKDGKEKKGKGGAEVIPYVSITPNQPLQSPESPLSNGHPGGFSRVAPTAASSIISQQAQQGHMTTSSFPVPAAQLATQRVQSETLTQGSPHLIAGTSTVNSVLLKSSALPIPTTTGDREAKSSKKAGSASSSPSSYMGAKKAGSASSSPSSYMGANGTVGNSRRDVETGLERSLANLKLSSNRSNATSGTSTKSRVQAPASSLHNPKREKHDLSEKMNSAKPVNRTSGSTQRKYAPTQKSTSVNKSAPRQPQTQFSGRSSKASSQLHETESDSRPRSSSPRNAQPQNKSSKRSTSQKLKPSTTPAATAASAPHSSRVSQTSGSVRPQAGRNTSSHGGRKAEKH